MNTYQQFAKGGGGGGHASSGGGRSSASSSMSSSSSSSSKSSSSKSTSTKSTTKTTVTKTKPGGTLKTADGKTIQTSSAKPTNAKFSQSKGVVGDSGYSPRFNNYSAPAGSVVYYPNHSFVDYLPWIYIFSQNNSPRVDQAVVVQPDGKQVQAQPVKSGVDGMFIFNWIILILLAAAVVAGVMYVVNKLTKKDKKNEF